MSTPMPSKARSLLAQIAGIALALWAIAALLPSVVSAEPAAPLVPVALSSEAQQFFAAVREFRGFRS